MFIYALLFINLSILRRRHYLYLSLYVRLLIRRTKSFDVYNSGSTARGWFLDKLFFRVEGTFDFYLLPYVFHGTFSCFGFGFGFLLSVFALNTLEEKAGKRTCGSCRSSQRRSFLQRETRNERKVHLHRVSEIIHWLLWLPRHMDFEMCSRWTNSRLSLLSVYRIKKNPQKSFLEAGKLPHSMTNYGLT